MDFNKFKKFWVVNYWLALLVGLMSAVFLLCLLFYNSLCLSIIISTIPILATKGIKNYSNQQLNSKREQEFMQFVYALSSLISVGKSFENSFKQSSKELAQDKSCFLIVDELNRIARCFEMNMSLGEGLKQLADKYKLESIINFAAVVELAVMQGGSVEKVIESTVLSIQEKDDVEKELEVIITQKRFELLIMMTFVPVMILYLRTVFVGFETAMYMSFRGRLIMTVCLVIYLFGGYSGKKIVDIEV